MARVSTRLPDVVRGAVTVPAKRLRPPRAAPLPDMVSLDAAVCGMVTSLARHAHAVDHVSAMLACMDHLELPPPDVQSRILGTLRDVHGDMEPDALRDGIAAWMLLHGELELFQRFEEALSQAADADVIVRGIAREVGTRALLETIGETPAVDT